MQDLLNLPQILAHYPKYRLAQAEQVIWVDLADSWDSATSLPKDLRAELTRDFSLAVRAVEFTSSDGSTVKILITLEDGLKVEAVLMRNEDRNTVCVSTQVGCPMACAFCATGAMGFQRDLTATEIVLQVLYFARLLKKEVSDDGQVSKVDNIVFMGMGEPLLNYENVLTAIHWLNDAKKFNLGARHMSISTVGIVPGIKRLAKEKMQFNLAVSLHAPNDQLRSRLIPANKMYSIEQVLRAVDEYIKIAKRRVMFEYILLKGVNDSDAQARELARLMKKRLYLVNLIAYNATGKFEASDSHRIDRFRAILEDAGVSVTERQSFGTEISAACGQLAGRRGQ